MRLFTTKEQTQKLVELGFNSPQSIKSAVPMGIGAAWLNREYSLGELISMLPERTYSGTLYMELQSLWNVGYSNTVLHCSDNELIDAVFSLAVKLKEIGYYDIKDKGVEIDTF